MDGSCTRKFERAARYARGVDLSSIRRTAQAQYARERWRPLRSVGSCVVTPPLVIAIDGPSGSGKSTVAKAVATDLDIGYLDTGAMYRALAWWCLHEGIDLSDEAAVADAAATMPLSQGYDPDSAGVAMAGEDITAGIRTDEVTSVVSTVATNLSARPILQQRQRDVIEELVATRGGVVAEGRDITTVVAPNAPVRILLTADEEARLRRRSAENHGHASGEAIDATREHIVGRDAADSAVSNFTVAADGVVVIDTSDLTLAESISAVLAVVREQQQVDT